MGKSKKGPYLNVSNDKEFYFSHFTGKVAYDIRDMSLKNRDFLPPEMTETLRLSSDTIIREFFSNNLNKTGNIIYEVKEEKRNWSSALVAEQERMKVVVMKCLSSFVNHVISMEFVVEIYSRNSVFSDETHANCYYNVPICEFGNTARSKYWSWRRRNAFRQVYPYGFAE